MKTLWQLLMVGTNPWCHGTVEGAHTNFVFYLKVRKGQKCCYLKWHLTDRESIKRFFFLFLFLWSLENRSRFLDSRRIKKESKSHTLIINLSKFCVPPTNYERKIPCPGVRNRLSRVLFWAIREEPTTQTNDEFTEEKGERPTVYSGNMISTKKKVEIWLDGAVYIPFLRRN